MSDLLKPGAKAVRLRVFHDLEFVEISCERCSKTVVQGDLRVIQVSLDELLRRAAVFHSHEGHG
jgi:hypothetical protein